ncbi:MAG: radical SAM protein [Bdellovibrionota bacterium]
MKKLQITEIFHSLQGEATQAGRPTVFVRLTGCPLRCTYCDTEYAFHGGTSMSVEEVVERVTSYDCNLVEVTGGEPLSQPLAFELLRVLAEKGFELMLETSGALSIEQVHAKVKVIMDIKTPSSGESHRNLWDNIQHLQKEKDEIKFVVSDQKDLEYCDEIVRKHQLQEKATLLLSPNFGKIDHQKVASWILQSKIPYRMQLQMHKYIWDPQARGV